MSNKKLDSSLSGRAFLYTLGQLALNFLSVISAPIFVRLMTTSEYGMAAIFFTWVTILSNVVALRADASIQNACSEFGEERLPGYVSSVSSLALCSSLLFFIFALVNLSAFSSLMGMNSAAVLLCVATSFAIACSNIRLSYLTVTRNASSNMVISLVLSIAQIGCSIAFLLLFTGQGYFARVVGYSAPSLIMGVFFLAFFYIKGGILFNREYWRFCLVLSLPLIFNGIAYLLINQCDRLMINSMLGPASAGIYSFAYSCALPASVVCSAMNSAWTPEFFSMMKDGKQDEIMNRSRGYMTNMTAVSAAILLVCPEILVVLGTPEYYSGIPMLPMVVMAYFFQFMYTWPVNCEFYYKKTAWMTGATIIATAVNVGMNFLLIPAIGAFGAAVASLAAFALLFVMHDVIARIKTPHYLFSWSWYMQGIVPMMIALAVCYLFLDWAVVRWVLAVFVIAFLLRRLIKRKTLF
ncbi:lipopolysaccharide biosynthesis protein [Enorma phocaeensis]|uniref:Oligosaccharide flippase family protein n=1 Tax=Enorma phocaeensis TaxID=1871019 RepID=A0ABT7V6P3_9ACTN|nr:oligosaccharide flippase family protein [Enorma phocaeensis]MDM8274170.1 oligosaccharide flippase family protein [Enorma phocaeensis]